MKQLKFSALFSSEKPWRKLDHCPSSQELSSGLPSGDQGPSWSLLWTREARGPLVVSLGLMLIQELSGETSEIILEFL